jgi:CspA family cold shock protein
MCAKLEKGKVKWFNENKGYGVIRTEKGKEVKVHYKDIVGEGFVVLEEGEEVEFILNKGKAKKVRKISHKEGRGFSEN